MDLKEIQNLIKFVARSGTSEVKLETDDFKITIKTGSGDSVTTVVQQTAVPMQQPVLQQPTRGSPVQRQLAAPAHRKIQNTLLLNLQLLELFTEDLLQTNHYLQKLVKQFQKAMCFV